MIHTRIIRNRESSLPRTVPQKVEQFSMLKPAMDSHVFSSNLKNSDIRRILDFSKDRSLAHFGGRRKQSGATKSPQSLGLRGYNRIGR